MNRFSSFALNNQGWKGKRLASPFFIKGMESKRVLLGQAKRVRFKGKNQMDSLEGKRRKGPMRWENETLAWKGLYLNLHYSCAMAKVAKSVQVDRALENFEIKARQRS